MGRKSLARSGWDGNSLWFVSLLFLVDLGVLRVRNPRQYVRVSVDECGRNILYQKLVMDGGSFHLSYFPQLNCHVHVELSSFMGGWVC